MYAAVIHDRGSTYSDVCGAGVCGNVHEPPLGFITTDISPERWAQLNPEYRFKGKVGDTLRFEQIQDVYVIRCFMHVLNRAHIEKTVEDAIPAEREFLSGAIPEKLWRAKEPALLTVLFTTKKGGVGLMNIYAGVTIVEMNSRYGAVGNTQR